MTTFCENNEHDHLSTNIFSWLTLSLPESNLESINVVVPFESVDETLVCDHSIESYWVVLSRGAACLWPFCKIIFSLSFELSNLGCERVKNQTLPTGIIENVWKQQGCWCWSWNKSYLLNDVSLKKFSVNCWWY